MKVDLLYSIFKAHPKVCTDTRNVVVNSLFFALKGDNFNGNEFAGEALKKGAAFAIVDQKEFAISDQYLLVDDVLKCLQDLANYHRKQFDIPFIGITGTNGKTTTKELLDAVLNKKYKTTATVGNLNNHIGVPLTLLSVPVDCEMAIIEMGANHVNEIDFLCNIAEPNYGIITNIGKAHIEGFGSVDAIKKTKNELYLYIKAKNGTLFVNDSNPILADLSKNISKVTYGDENSDIISKLTSTSPQLSLQWFKQDKAYPIRSNLYGGYNYENILAAITIGDYFGVSEQQIVTAIEQYSPNNNRSQVVKCKSYTLFLDAYNANPTSMKAAIETFSESTSKNKLMILGDMLELGDTSNLEHQKIVDDTNAKGISAVFIGKEFNAVKDKYAFTYLNNHDDAIRWLEQKKTSYSEILIKGSRGIQLEKVSEYLRNNT